MRSRAEVQYTKAYSRHRTYDLIAAEYYDHELHPTCASLRAGSEVFLEAQLAEVDLKRCNILEVGSGDSLTAQLINSRSMSPLSLVLSDSSINMLMYSKKWKNIGAQLLAANAMELPIADCSVNVLISVLGDPYNLPIFWREVSRVLTHSGVCFFTLPSYYWAMAFRDRNDATKCESAEFTLRDGTVVETPSFIPHLSEQIAIIETAGLYIDQVIGEKIQQNAAYIAPKLNVIDTNRDPIIFGIRARKKYIS